MAIIAMLLKKPNENQENVLNVAYKFTHVPPISLMLANAWPPIILLRMQKPKL